MEEKEFKRLMISFRNDDLMWLESTSKAYGLTKSQVIRSLVGSSRMKLSDESKTPITIQ